MKLAISVCLVLGFFGLADAQEPQASPPQIREEVVVTANRTETKIGDTPASIVIISRRDLESSAAPTADDVLRQTVGFSIFRRSSSRNANPTTQGVSLRGVGASGASRSVVLFDGVPLNDPFGGWVQWNRVSPVAIETVEVLRGGASSLYGDSSLSGAINVIPREVKDKYLLSGDVYGGTQKTISGSGFAGIKYNGWSADLAISNMQTKGYKPVDQLVRGPVDAYAGTRSTNISPKISRRFGEHVGLFVRPSYFGEVRTNGTGLLTNRTHIRQLVVGGDLSFSHAKDFRLNWRVYGGTQIFDQTFTSINATRTTESLIRVQRAPVQNIVASIQFSAVVNSQTLVGGVESRNTRGASNEIAIANNLPTSLIGSGGRQTSVGAFFQDLVRIGKKLVISGSVRVDRWQNYAALSAARVLSTNVTTVTKFADRDEHAVSPTISMLYHLSDSFSFYASASKSFRAPTLNELYRAFRVGTVSTLANENLVAERAKNCEGGVSFTHKRSFLRSSVFLTKLDRPVANVTLTATPTLITRQRQNMGKTQSRGVEIEGETGFREFRFSAGYILADSTVTEFPANIALVGLLVPQVARHQFTFQARYAPGKWTLAVQGRASSHQFDDDVNLFRLEPYSQIDLFFGRRLKERLQIYAAVENIFNSRYSIAKTPIRSVSSPTLLRAGIRWH